MGAVEFCQPGTDEYRFLINQAIIVYEESILRMHKDHFRFVTV
jgi:hypothetical protein